MDTPAPKTPAPKTTVPKTPVRHQPRRVGKKSRHDSEEETPTVVTVETALGPHPVSMIKHSDLG